MTGEEICDNCMEEAHLIEIGTPNNIGDNSDYEVYMSNYKVPVKAELVKLSDSMLEYERDDYMKVVTNLYEDFCKKMQVAHRAYLACKIRDLL